MSVTHSAAPWPQSDDKDDGYGQACYSPMPTIPQRSRQRPNQRSIDSTQSFETAHSSVSISTRDSAVFSSNDNSTVPSPQQLDREWPDPHWDLKTPTLESFQDAFQPRTHSAGLDEPFSASIYTSNSNNYTYDTASATTETDSLRAPSIAPRIPAARLHIPPSIYVPETLPLTLNKNSSSNTSSPQLDCNIEDPFAIPQHTPYNPDRTQHRHLSHNFNLDDYRYDNYDDTRDFVLESDDTFSLTDSASLRTDDSPRTSAMPPKRRLEKELPPLPPLDHVSPSGLNKRIPPGRQQTQMNATLPPLPPKDRKQQQTQQHQRQNSQQLSIPSSPPLDVHRALQFKDPFLTPWIDKSKLRQTNENELDSMSIKANDDVGHDNDSESYLPSGYRSMDPYLRDSYMGAIQGDHMMEKSSSSSEDEIQINTANVVIIKREDERQQSTYLDPTAMADSVSSGDFSFSQFRIRVNLLRELYMSEVNYYKDLSVALKVYQRTLNSSRYRGFVCKHDKDVLFSNLDEILQVSSRLIKNIRKNCPAQILDKRYPIEGNELGLVTQDLSTQVGQVLLDSISEIELSYQTYCNDNEKQMETFYRLSQLAPPRLLIWFYNCTEYTKETTTAWTLDSLLIKPVQRLLKYPLLLKNMLSVTLASHPDYMNVRTALVEYEVVADRINNVKKLFDNNKAVQRDLPPPPSQLATPPMSPRHSQVSSASTQSPTSFYSAEPELRELKGVFERNSMGGLQPVHSHISSSHQSMLSPTSSTHFERRKASSPTELHHGSSSKHAKLAHDELFTQKLLHDQIFFDNVKSFYKHGHYIRDMFKLMTVEMAKIDDFMSSSKAMTVLYERLLPGRAQEVITLPVSDTASMHSSRSAWSARSNKSPHETLTLQHAILKQKMTARVLAPLQQMLQIYDVVRSKIKKRDRLEGYYIRYLSHEWDMRPPINLNLLGLNSDHTLVVPPNLEPTTLKRTQELADMYITSTVSLKDEFPQLFQMTQEVSKTAFATYIHIKQDWTQSFKASLPDLYI
ncbi:hypothetical protein B0I71DRAFT_133828 [Yarrowia lipolytica]|uniref:DH domain-containing protein n=1 Tax=Yarrowia lipolytica TaxID=4952 RepID=A0A371C336_YARLL|nr:hypothetical protein B0I71DRAFT_133828 [Yarrowia lipolytica]